MKVIHYDATVQDRHQLASMLRGARYEHVWSDELLSPDTADAQAEAISVFVSTKVTAKCLAAMPKLRLIACRSTGYDNVDLEAVRRQGITVVNVPTYGEHTVAEYTIGLLLAFSRRIPQALASFHASDAERGGLQGFDLVGKRFGLIGTGRIGRNVGSLAAALGMQVTAYDPFPDQAWAGNIGAEYESLDQLLAASDVVSLHTPYLSSTHHLLDAKRIGLMKKTAVVVNTARGELIETAALIDALASGRLAGAALDVFEGETALDIHNELAVLHGGGRDKLAESVQVGLLQKLPNTVITNHNAFNTTEAINRINQTVAANIEAFTAGHLQNVIEGA